MSFFNNNNIFVWGFLAINTLHIISIMSSIYIHNMCCISDIITISIFSVNYVFLINGEYSGAWITMWLFPICIIVLYEICLYFELSQTEIEDMILLISTIFIVILVLLFSIHILAFYYKSVLIFLLIYKLYLSVYTLKFCFFMATFICSFTIVNTLLIVKLEQFEIGCNRIRRDLSTRHSHIVKFFVLVVTFIRYAKIYNLSHVFLILLFKLTFFVSVTLFFYNNFIVKNSKKTFQKILYN